MQAMQLGSVFSVSCSAPALLLVGSLGPIRKAGVQLPTRGATCGDRMQVAQLRAELQEMRQLVTAQGVLSEQQQLTITSLQRLLLGTPSGSGPPLVGTQSAIS